jgi:chemotaxis protein MotB
MPARAPHGSNQPPKIIVKKIFVDGHGGHHGGAWKVAYADFVTAMMAFFLLLWLLGATTEKQRKSLADYFAPTLVTMRENSAGSHGLFGGESITDKDHYPHRAQQTGTRSMTIPVAAAGGNQVGSGQKGSLKSRAELAKEDARNFERLHRQVVSEIGSNPKLKGLAKHVHFVRTHDGLRIDLLDDADYSMFTLGTTQLAPAAAKLLDLIAESIKATDNPIMIRGHTDSLSYGDRKTMNNWMLSTGRAEATRQRLAAAGIPEDRFDRIEGVADREPMIADNPADPRNRRVAITLLYRRGVFGQ